MAVAEPLVLLLLGCLSISAEAISDEKRNRPGAFPLPVQPHIILSPVYSSRTPSFLGHRVKHQHSPSSLQLLTPHTAGTSCLQRISKERAEHDSSGYIHSPAWRGHSALSSIVQRQLVLFHTSSSLLQISLGMKEKQETHDLLERWLESK